MLLFGIRLVVFREEQPGYIFLLLVQFAPILLFLTIYGGGVQAVAGGGTSSVARCARYVIVGNFWLRHGRLRAKSLLPLATSTPVPAKHVHAHARAVRGKLTRSHRSLSVVYAAQHLQR